jgi:hypothetical protein
MNGWSRPVTPDPPEAERQCADDGYGFLSRPSNWTPPAALEAFLAADLRLNPSNPGL